MANILPMTVVLSEDDMRGDCETIEMTLEQMLSDRTAWELKRAIEIDPEAWAATPVDHERRWAATRQARAEWESRSCDKFECSVCGRLIYSFPAREKPPTRCATCIGMSKSIMPPVAIGGIGGSGTRVIASFLDTLGFYLGDDLNEARDNLWFTLLFKRRSILLENEEKFCGLASLFFSRMSGEMALSDGERSRIFQLAEHDRLQHPRDWLLARALSFSNGKSSKRVDQPWGWKEPNTQIVIDRLFDAQPTLRYIHVVRHPLDMAVSANQNQLENWGPIFLSRNVGIEPRWSLSYWCAAHRRILKFIGRWPERAMVIDFDELCKRPEPSCEIIAEFVGATLSVDAVSSFRDWIRPRPAAGSGSLDLGQFDPADLAYVAKIGYTV
jgi:hypothetical protein